MQLVMGWLANNSAPHYVRATAMGFQICIANCAAFLATFVYVQKDAYDSQRRFGSGLPANESRADRSTPWVIRSTSGRWCCASYLSSYRWLTRRSRTANETRADGTTGWRKETRLCLVFIILGSDTRYRIDINRQPSVLDWKMNTDSSMGRSDTLRQYEKLAVSHGGLHEEL